MPVIHLEILIHAPIERCFDLSRSIDLHKISTEHTHEEAIAGITEGLIGLNETVTWRAKHIGIYQTLTSKITEFESPRLFVDEMVSGPFKSIRHEHHFEESNGATLMKDHFQYASPFGIFGRIADFLFLKNYLKDLIIKRNQTIKEFAESERWSEVLQYE